MAQRIGFRVLLWSLGLLTASTAWAQPGPQLREITSARAFAMGGAFRATGLGAEAIDGNPAALGLVRRYQVELTGGYNPPSRFGFGNANVMDGITTSIAGGVSYKYVPLGDDTFRVYSHLATLALALPMSERLSVGLSGRYLNASGAYNSSGITMDAGLVFRATDSFHIGVSGANLIDIRSPLLWRSGAVSFAYVGDGVVLAADVRGDFLPNTTSPLFTYSFGGEYLVGDTIPLRAGYAFDNVTQSQFVSAGLGIIASGTGVDFTYRHELGGSQSRLMIATLKIQIQ